MYINQIYEVGSYVFNLCAKGDGKEKVGVKTHFEFFTPMFQKKFVL